MRIRDLVDVTAAGLTMDSSTLKLLLESQERAYKLALDAVVKQMQDQINKLENKVSDLITSLEYTQREVDELKSSANQHKTERKEDKLQIGKLIQQLDSSTLMIKNLEDKVVYQEDYSRRKNLRISGLEEQQNETWEQTATAVTSLLESKLQLPGIVLERAHRVGPRQDTKPRTIVARFNRYGDREAAMRRGKHLKGTNIFLNEDLSSASLAVRNAQLPMYKQAKADGKIAFFRHTKLIIREKQSEDGARRQGQRRTEDATDDRLAGGEGGVVGGDLASGARGNLRTATNTNTAGAWTGRDDTRLLFPALQSGGSPAATAAADAAAAVSVKQKESKRDLRSNKNK